MSMSCVAHSTNYCVKNRRCITIKNNVPCYRHQGQNAVPSDEDWPRGCCLYDIWDLGTSEWMYILYYILCCFYFVCWLLYNTRQWCYFSVWVLCVLYRRYHHQKQSFLFM